MSLQTQLRCLDYYETKEGRQLCFNDTLKPAQVVPVGSRMEIIWSPSHPDAVERSAPEGTAAYRLIGEPRKNLGRSGETAIIQYYRIR